MEERTMRTKTTLREVSTENQVSFASTGCTHQRVRWPTSPAFWYSGMDGITVGRGVTGAAEENLRGSIASIIV